jgi:hypothetical protein
LIVDRCRALHVGLWRALEEYELRLSIVSVCSFVRKVLGELLLVAEGLVALRCLDLLAVPLQPLRILARYLDRSLASSRLLLIVALLKLLQLLLEVLGHQLEGLAVALARLGIANPSNDPESVDKLVEGETIVR